MPKTISVKLPTYGVAISTGQKLWAEELSKGKLIDKLYEHIINMLQKALMLQQKIGVLSRNNKPVQRWNGNPEIQLLIMSITFENHQVSLMAVLIPTMGNEKQLEYAAKILIEDYEYFRQLALHYGLRPWMMEEDESISQLTDLNNPIIKHIREQVERFEENPYQALKDKKLILSEDTINYLKKELGPNNEWLI